jgi:hypothetical protein
LKILAIDAGTIRSGFCFFDTDALDFYDGNYSPHGKIENVAFKTILSIADYDHLVMEDITPFSSVGATTIETIKWLGRFESLSFRPHTYITRQQVKKHLIGKVNGMKDKHVREAVIKRMYPKFSRKDQGPLKGVTADAWSAVALALTFADRVNGNVG